MSANDQLQLAYQQWRQLAEAEGEAIRGSNWPAVERCQNSLHELQPQIIHWTQEARDEWKKLGRDVSSEENSLRSIIGELIEIERRNCVWLNEVQETTRAQMADLNQCGYTLRQVHRSYSHTRGPAWSSFS
ncbi:MAG TPA: hypothetical protein VK327_01480 [Candidatus Paceibacterota bacterium]|nr:hypothetical protein [Candidatus Paceibacterota bacterium]